MKRAPNRIPVRCPAAPPDAHSRSGRANLWVLVLLGLLALLLVRTQFRLCLVAGWSMWPGLHPGDVLLVDQRAYRNAAPQRGDLVVARDNAGLIVKRVVGLPGEEVEVRWGTLFINGASFPEPYAASGDWLNLGRGRLLAGRYALLGDNRAHPGSASTHAVVSREQILGKVTRVFPLGRWAFPVTPFPS